MRGLGSVTRLLARVRAMGREQWEGRAGERFRSGVKAVAEEGTKLAARKIEGLASREHAASEKDYADAMKAFSESEDKKMDAVLKRRSLESRVRREEAEASLAETKAIEARFDLMQKLNTAGVVLRIDEPGRFLLLPKADPDHAKPYGPRQIMGPPPTS